MLKKPCGVTEYSLHTGDQISSILFQGSVFQGSDFKYFNVLEAVHIACNQVQIAQTGCRKAAPHINLLIMLHSADTVLYRTPFIVPSPHPLLHRITENKWRLFIPQNHAPLFRSPSYVISRPLYTSLSVSFAYKWLLGISVGFQPPEIG